MNPLILHDFHRKLGARFGGTKGQEVVTSYGNERVEQVALSKTVGVLDLSFRGRLCVVGSDRERFLNGQVTNDVKALREGEGCYAGIVNAKGRMESDLNIHRLEDEYLLDFEAGLSDRVSQRLDRYIIAEDVQIADAAPHYGLLSIQGPMAVEATQRLDLGSELPSARLAVLAVPHAQFGDLYVVNHARLDSVGFDVYVPVASVAAAAEKLIAAAQASGGGACGWDVFEAARIEAAIPRYGIDIEESNLAPEAGIEERAISYSKGCYIGQEVIARIRTYGQVAKTLRGLRLADDLVDLPQNGTPLLSEGREVGYLTSVLKSPSFAANIALGYVRREVNSIGSELVLRTATGESMAGVVCLPFAPAWEPSIRQ